MYGGREAAKIIEIMSFWYEMVGIFCFFGCFIVLAIVILVNSLFLSMYLFRSTTIVMFIPTSIKTTRKSLMKLQKNTATWKIAFFVKTEPALRSKLVKVNILSSFIDRTKLIYFFLNYHMSPNRWFHLIQF